MIGKFIACEPINNRCQLFAINARNFAGEKSGKKFDAGEIAEKMGHERTRDGAHRFEPHEIFGRGQIASFWSTYARKVRRGEVISGAADADDVSIENDEIVEVPNNAYVNDPNVDAVDDLLSEQTERAMIGA